MTDSEETPTPAAPPDPNTPPTEVPMTGPEPMPATDTVLAAAPAVAPTPSSDKLAEALRDVAAKMQMVVWFRYLEARVSALERTLAERGHIVPQPPGP